MSKKSNSTRTELKRHLKRTGYRPAPKGDAQRTLDLIRRGALDNLLVDVSAQGMAYADFLEFHGVHFRRVRWDAAAGAFRPLTAGSGLTESGRLNPECGNGYCPVSSRTKRPASKKACAACKKRRATC